MDTIILTGIGIGGLIWAYTRTNIAINKFLGKMFYSLGFYPKDEIIEVTVEIQCDRCGKFVKPYTSCCNHRNKGRNDL